MSQLTDILKSGASSVAGAVSEKLGIDPATAEGFINRVIPSDQIEAEQADDQQTEITDQMQAAPTDELPADVTDQEQVALTDEAASATEGLLGQASAMFGGSQGIMDKAKGLLDQDGDGNPLNDVTASIGKFFGKS
jgi:hypothetical protein